MSAAADRANAVRWDGRRGRYEVWYLVVAGRFWLRYTLRVPSDPAGEGECALWLVSFEGTPVARRELFPLELFRASAGGWPIEVGPGSLSGRSARGEVEGARWELELTPHAEPFAYAHPLVRALRVAKTELVCSVPALTVSGVIEVDGVRHSLDRAPGHQAHVWGSRHAQRWGWAHANAPDGRWVELLAAKVPGAPQLALHASDEGRHNGPLELLRTPASVAFGSLAVGPYRVEADPVDIVGVTYLDPDGTPAYCYHAERARLRGPGIEVDTAALEYGTREPLPGVPLAL